MSVVNEVDWVTLLSAVVATGASPWLAVDGAIGSSTVVELTFAGTATVTFQGTLDGVTANTIQAERLDTGNFAGTASASALYRIETAGMNAVRANVTVWSSGAVTAKAASQAG
jgi:hypothetical protein